MANLHNYHGCYCEAEFESTFLSYLEEAGGAIWPEAASRAIPCGTCYTLMTWSFS